MILYSPDITAVRRESSVYDEVRLQHLRFRLVRTGGMQYLPKDGSRTFAVEISHLGFLLEELDQGIGAKLSEEQIQILSQR